MPMIRLLLPMFLLLMVLCHLVAAGESDIAKGVFEEMNRVRTDPKGYVKVLQDFRARFRGDSYEVAPNTLVQTQEGTAAVDEAIRVLKQTKPLPPLHWSSGLAAAASDLAKDQAETGQTGHNGSRSGGMRERIEHHGKWRGQIGENIGYGPSQARLMVISLLVDDGVADRGHRKNILSSAYHEAGVACGRHPRFRNLCVIDFATAHTTGRTKRPQKN